MAQNRFYSSTAVSTTLTGTISSGATTFSVASAAGFPSSVPFTLLLERDTALEEVVTVTAIAGTTITNCVRGADGTTAVGHVGGATVAHGVSARDFNEPQAHIGAVTGVHGVAGTLVGTSDAQTLTNKTLADPAIIRAGNAVTIPSAGVDTFALLNAIQTLTNKTLTAPTIATINNGGVLTLPTGARTLVARDTTDTLTNKTLTAPAISAPAFSGSATGLVAAGAVLDAASTVGGISGTTLAADQGAWANFTPVWTAATTNPVLGNGAFNCRFKQVGKTVYYHFRLTMGSTTTFGTGNWIFTLPSNAANTGTTAGGCGQLQVVKATITSGVQSGRAYALTASTMQINSGGSSGAVWDQATPSGSGAWAAGDSIDGVLVYEAA